MTTARAADTPPPAAEGPPQGGAELEALRAKLRSAQDQIDRLEAANGQLQRTAKGSPEGAREEQRGSPGATGRKDDGGEEDGSRQGASASESSSGEEDSAEEAEAEAEAGGVPPPPGEEAPLSPEDIRLRAARTLIWADSSIKRAEASKQAAAGSVTSPPSLPPPPGERDGGRWGSGGGSTPRVSARSMIPTTVRVESHDDGDSASGRSDYSSDFDDEGSELSMDDYSRDGADGRDRRRRRGPLAGIRKLIEDVADEVVDLHIARIEDASPAPPAPKYCNDAFRRLAQGLGDHDSALSPGSHRSNRTSGSHRSNRTPTSLLSGSSRGSTSVTNHTPFCNDAMIRLSSEKKRSSLGAVVRSASGGVSKLFAQINDGRTRPSDGEM